MKVIIPAAGIGTRLRPHTHTAPKALLPVAGKPILAHIIDRLLPLENVDEYLIVTGFLGGMVQDYVNNNYRLNVRYVQQDELLGLGFAVHLALQDIEDDPVLIVLGDTILETDFSHFVQPEHDVLGVREVDDPKRFGLVELVDGKITRLVEKPDDPPSNLAVIGIYGISNTLLLTECLHELISREQKTRGEYQITDALQMMVERGSVMVPHKVRGWFDCGKLETLLETNRHLLDRDSETPQREGSVILPPSYVAASAEITNSIIGPYASVGDRAVVRESIIRDTIIGAGAAVQHAVLEQSMIGNAASVTGRLSHLNVGDFSDIGYH